MASVQELLIFNSPKNSGGWNPKELAYGAICHTGAPKRLGMGKETIRVGSFQTARSCVPALFDHINRIIFCCSWKQMVRSNARRVVALVKNIQPARYGPVYKGVGNSMGEKMLSADSGITVPAFRFPSHPKPAPARFFHLQPKSNSNRNPSRQAAARLAAFVFGPEAPILEAFSAIETLFNKAVIASLSLETASSRLFKFYTASKTYANVLNYHPSILQNTEGV